jgi:hypothetical protein
MAMSKQDFIALADTIREANQQDERANVSVTFKARTIEKLADFCQLQNPRFMRSRWLGYIRGENGKNGGAIRKAKVA